MKLFTIGFSNHSAEEFFTTLKKSGVKRLIDTRISPGSQLSGFARQKDLPYFLRQLAKIDYIYEINFAPTSELLTAYRGNDLTWDEYAKKYLHLLKKRKVEKLFSKDELHGSCLLCSEYLPHHCHRRLLAEYLKSKGLISDIIHLSTI